MFLLLRRTVKHLLQYQKVYHVASRHRSLHLFCPVGGRGERGGEVRGRRGEGRGKGKGGVKEEISIGREGGGVEEKREEREGEKERGGVWRGRREWRRGKEGEEVSDSRMGKGACRRERLCTGKVYNLALKSVQTYLMDVHVPFQLCSVRRPHFYHLISGKYPCHHRRV